MEHTELWHNNTPETFKSLPDVDKIIENANLTYTVTIGKHAGQTFTDLGQLRVIQDRYFAYRDSVYETSHDSISASTYIALNAQKCEFIFLQHTWYAFADLCMCPKSGRRAPSSGFRYLDEDIYGERILVHTSITNVTVHDQRILNEDAIFPVYSNAVYHKADTEDLVWSETYDNYIEIDDAVYPEDDDEPMHQHDCFYSETNGLWYHYRDNMPEHQAKRDVLHDYHHSPKPDFYILPDLSVLSKYTIGFEVEKNSIDEMSEICVGDNIPEEPIFAGWETDSSCGFEGITNVYSLNNEELFIKHAKQSYLLDDSCDSSCGGHINISDTEKTLKYWHLKPWLGLFWSMWRKRLNNNYSNANKKACPYRRSTNRYSALNEKTTDDNQTLFELRLPNRVSSREVIIRRFKLMQNFMRCVDMFKTEDFSYTQAKYDDRTFGIPNVITEAIDEQPRNSSNRLKLIPRLGRQTYQRTRFHIESQLSLLQEMYPEPEKLTDIIVHAYLFQGYIDEEFAKPDAKNWIIAEISQYL